MSDSITNQDRHMGSALRGAREMQQRSLREVSRQAQITPTYLKKLEEDQVREPSPNILHRLSGTLGLSYGDLLQLAGYVVPTSNTDSADTADALSVALKSVNLTPDELEHMIQYIGFLKKSKR